MHPSTDEESLCTYLGILWIFRQVICPMGPQRPTWRRLSGRLARSHRFTSSWTGDLPQCNPPLLSKGWLASLCGLKNFAQSQAKYFLCAYICLSWLPTVAACAAFQ